MINKKIHFNILRSVDAKRFPGHPKASCISVGSSRLAHSQDFEHEVTCSWSFRQLTYYLYLSVFQEHFLYEQRFLNHNLSTVYAKCTVKSP